MLWKHGTLVQSGGIWSVFPDTYEGKENRSGGCHRKGAPTTRDLARKSQNSCQARATLYQEVGIAISNLEKLFLGTLELWGESLLPEAAGA